MATTQSNRTFAVASPLGKDALLFRELSGSEQVSGLFELRYELLSERGDLDADKILGQGLTLSYRLLAGATRYLHGIVTEFSQTGYLQRYHRYRAVVRPWLWLLTRTADCRSFQGKSVPEIFEQVVKQYGFSDYKLKLQSSYQPLNYCVQYRETDFNFLSRLLEHEGIHYYFEHSDGRHVIVLADDPSAHQAVGGYDRVSYLPPGSEPSMRTSEHLYEWSATKRVQPGAYATGDFDFEAPRNSLAANASTSRQYAHSDFEIFDYPGDLDTLEAGESKRIAKVRLDELQAGYLVAHGQGDVAGLAPGFKFALADYPRSDLNIEYLVLAAQYSMSSDVYTSEGGGSAAGEGDSCSIAVQAIDARTAYRPPRVTPKPLIHGAQTAIVVGEGSAGGTEQIYTDKYGRVKVQFHWDRYAKGDQNSSCWVRVAQVWAGKQWGALHLPRVGHEVLVEFLEGDPDRPIVTGRVYNADNMPPYALPDNATQSGIKSRSSEDGAADDFNEIRFEDKKGSELVYLHAQKDFNTVVEHDRSLAIGHDETASVGNDRHSKVGNDETCDVSQDHETTIGRNEKRSVGQDRSTTVSGNDTLSVGKDESRSIGQRYVLTAGDEISLETGASRLVMKSDGTIELQGTSITIDASQSLKQTAGDSVEVDGMQVKLSGTTIGVQGTQTSVEGTLLDLKASAVASLNGALTKIG